MSEIKMTEEEIIDWCRKDEHHSWEGMVFAFARHVGVLKAKVKKWRWWYRGIDGYHVWLCLEGEDFAERCKTEKIKEYGKCEGTEVECDE